MDADEAEVRDVIVQWDAAWNRHHADTLTALHHPDAETVNRFGRYVAGGDEQRAQFGWLHSGPFSRTQSPAQKVVSLRFIRQDVALLHTTWGTPELELDGATVPAEDMVVSYVVTKERGRWAAAAVDLHNVQAALGQEKQLLNWSA